MKHTPYKSLAHQLGINAQYDPKDLDGAMLRYVEIMLARTNMMFEYKNLPRTLPPSMLELMLQSYGTIAITHVPAANVLRNNQQDIPHSDPPNTPDEEDGTSTGTIDDSAPDLYAFRCTFGGEPDIYYRPTKAIIANPALNKSMELELGKECVMAKSDILGQGLLPIFKRYAFQMAHVDVSFYTALISTRMQTRIVANTGADFNSAMDYINRLKVGDLSAIASKPFLDGIQFSDPTSASHTVVTSLLDLAQYLKLSWYNELGIDPNISNKREYVSAEQLASSTDTLMPLVDNMLECRILMCEAINELYNTDIQVKKASAWQEKEMETIQEMMAEESGNGELVDQPDEGGEKSDESAS